MSNLLTCDDGQQPSSWCPSTTDEVIPSVLGLLPQGPAWDAARVPGTYQNSFWRAISEPIGYAYKRMCDYIPEFFCNTVDESFDQWIEEYGLDDECGIYGDNLCAKVTLVGGGQCEVFKAAALDAKWVVDCEDIDCPLPIAGCFECGCTPMGPDPVPLNRLPTVVNAPYTPTPGAIVFDVPDPVTPDVVLPSDSSGKWQMGFGCSFRWKLKIDLLASMHLQGIDAIEPGDETASNAGGLMAGCTPLCGPTSPGLILCFIEQIKPAHTLMETEVVVPELITDAFLVAMPALLGSIAIYPDECPGVADFTGTVEGYLYDYYSPSSHINVHDAFGAVIN